jgi:HEAT repeat protein
MTWVSLRCRRSLYRVFVLLALGCGEARPAKTAFDLFQDLNSKDEAVRIQAAANLRSASGADTKQVVSALSDALRDSSANVRQAASKSLAAMGPDAQAAVPILQRALKDSDEGVRLNAADALEKIRGKK